MAEDPFKRAREEADKVKEELEGLKKAGKDIAEAIKKAAQARQTPPTTPTTEDEQPTIPSPQQIQRRRILPQISRLPRIRLPRVSLPKAPELIGRALLPDRTLRRAFRGPFTTPPPPRQPPTATPPPEPPTAGPPEGFLEEYERLLREFARWHEYIYQNRDVLIQPERAKLEAIEKSATELENKQMVGRESYQEALSQLRYLVDNLRGISNSVSTRIEEMKTKIAAGRQRGPPIHTPTPGEPAETEVKSSAPGATVTERYGQRRGGGEGGGPPEGEREERRAYEWKRIKLTVKEKKNARGEELLGAGKPIQGARVTVSTPFIPPGGFSNSGRTKNDGTVEIRVPKIPVPYTAKAEKELYKTDDIEIEVDVNDPQDCGTIELEPEPLAALKRERKEKEEIKKLKEEEKELKKPPEEKEEREKVEKGEAGIFKGGKWWNPLSWRLNTVWLGANWLRFVIAILLTIGFVAFFYAPLFSALDQTLPYGIQWIVPVLFFFIMFYTLPRPDSKPKDWTNLVISIILAIGTWIAINLSPLSGGTFIQWGLPVAVYLLSFYTTKNSKSPIKTLTTAAGILLIIGGVLLVWNLISSGAAFNIETYLKTLDVLHLVGVPQDTIDNVKDGVRNVLSFLQFKGAEPLKPEAKKIGGFEAIQLKFGSRYNDFLLPTLFARTNYTLPVTVINPNKLDTKLTVENFVIDNAFMNNKSSRILCGSVTEGSSLTGKSLLGDIDPEEERLTTIEFGSKTNCETVVKTFSNVQNPMFPDKFTLRFENKNTGNKLGDCQEVCKTEGNDVVTYHNTRYQLSPGDRLDVNGSRYLSGDDMCECKVNKVHNVLDNLCFFDSNKAQISLKTSYGFKVQGKGELILVKSDADKKLAPKPSITSGAGPITVTTYFVSDVHVFGTSTQAKNMFIEIRNDGEGNAKITGLAINGFSVSKFYDIPPLAYIPLIKEDPEKVKITNCSPNPTVLSVSKESATVICTVKAEDSSIVTSNYRTLPAIVDVNYIYSQTHSTSVNIKKESIPDGVTDRDQIIELDINFKPLPYYCPNVEVPTSGTKPLSIYGIDAKPCNGMTESECKQNSNRCDYAPPVGQQTSGTCADK